MLQVNFVKNKKITNEQMDLIKNLFNIAIKTLSIKEKDIEVNVSFVSKSEIKNINKQHRNIDKVTDVLSFPTLNLDGKVENLKENLIKSNFPLDINYANNNLLIGDIIICYPVIKKQAKLFGNTIERELGYMFIHGVLHLLGFDHENDVDKKEMRKFEEKILEKVNLNRD